MESCGDTKPFFELTRDLEESLSNLVGMEKLKSQTRILVKGMILDEKRRALGSRVITTRLPHLAFLGNPGTGKTMVAQMLGRLLHKVGMLSNATVIEVQRTDLVGDSVWQTWLKTTQKIKEADGGILFVDEPYRLEPYHDGKTKEFFLVSLKEIISAMDGGEILVILAGHCEPMKSLLSLKQGLSTRITESFYFEDYIPFDLAVMLHQNMNMQPKDSSLHGFKLHPSCTVEVVEQLIRKETTQLQRRWKNGHLVDLLLARARENLVLRCDFYCTNADILIRITMQDLRKGLQSLRG